MVLFNLIAVYLSGWYGSVTGCYIGVWPLFTSEVQSDKYGHEFIFPQHYDCFEGGIGMDSHSYNQPSIVKFTQERRSFVDIDVKDESVEKLFISMFVHPSSGTGTLLHYRASNPSPAQVTEIIINLNNAVLNVKYCLDSDCTVYQHFSAGTVPLNEWTFLDIYRDKEGVFKSRDVEDKKDKKKYKDYEINLKGNLRLGGLIDQPIGDYSGLLQCVTMFSKKKSEDDTLKVCFNSQIRLRGCSQFVAKYLWPLNNKSLGYEAIKGIPPQNTQSLAIVTKDTTIAGVAVPSSINLSGTMISSSITFDDEMYSRYSVAMFVKQPNSVDTDLRTLLTIKPPSGAITKLSLKLNDTAVTAVIVLTNYQTIQLSQTVHSDWTFVAVQYNWYWYEMSLIADNSFTFKTFTQLIWVQQDPQQNTKLELEIGAVNGGFNGHINCLAIFNSPLSETSATELLKNECNLWKEYTAPAADDPKPLSIWPLDTHSMDFEMVSNTCITTSTTTDDMCWRFNEVNTNNIIDSEAVRFYGSDQFSLTIDNINAGELNLICFGIFVKAEVNATGTILQTFFKSQETPPVDYEISVRLEAKSLNVYMIAENNLGTPCASLANISFPEKEWVSIVVVGNALGNFKLILEDSALDFGGVCGSITNIIYSKIILGGEPSGAIGFLGELRCLSVFDKLLTAGEAKQLLKQGCSSSIDYKPVTKPEMQTTTTFWKLDRSTIVTEKRTNGMSLLNGNQSLYFDGSSRLHVLINVQIPNDDMSIGFFFRPLKYTNGTIIISEDINFRISIEKSIMSIMLDPSCDKIHFNKVTAEEWHWLMITRITSCKSLIFVLDGEVNYAHSRCFENTGLATLRLGGEIKSFDNFRGDLSCLAVFNKSVNSKVGKQSMINSCNLDTGYEHLVEEQGSALNNKISNTKYQLIKSNYVPLDRSGQLYMFDDVKTFLHCVGKCTSTRYCRSFIVTVAKNASLSCTLLDFITIDGLTSHKGSKYYGQLYTS